MILIVIAVALAAVVLLMYLRHAPSEFNEVHRREYAMELLRDMNPQWFPPKPRIIEHEAPATDVVFQFNDIE